MTTGALQGTAGPLFVLPRELGQVVPTASEVGTKAHHLARLMHLKARVPRFGILSVRGFDAHLATDSVKTALAQARRNTEEAALLSAADALCTAARNAPLASGVRDALEELVDSFTEEDLLAIRPSVIGTPIEVLALAGRCETFLFVRGKTAAREAVHVAFASAFSPAVVQARIDAGLDPFGTRLAIIIQRMVVADTSGAAASLDVDTSAGRAPQVIIEATLGLGGGSAREDSRLPTDTYRVTRPLLAEETLGDNAPVEMEVVAKRAALVLDKAQGHGTKLSPTETTLADAPALTSVQARLIADEALRLESLTGRPVSLEFAFAGRLLHLLQLHPLETPEGRIESPRERRFDRRVLPDDLAGPTLPLTQSWARRTLPDAFETALRELGASDPLPEDAARALPRLLATVQSDLTGNTGALRTCVAALDRGAWTDAAIARATGAQALDPSGGGTTARGALSTLHLVRACFRVGRDSRKLTAEFDAFAPFVFDESERIRFAGLEELDPDRLADLIDDLERHSLAARALQWRARLVTAFANEICAEMVARNVTGAPPATMADLCLPKPTAADLTLSQRSLDLADVVRKSKPLSELFDAEPRTESLLDRLEEFPAARTFEALLRSTLDHEGIVGAGAGHIEVPAFEERPDLLVDLVRLARRWDAPTLQKRIAAAEGRRKKAEYFVDSRLENSRALLVFKKKTLVHKIADAARAAASVSIRAAHVVRRLNGIFRRTALSLGTRLYEHDLLDQPADALWLHVDEMTGVVRGANPDASIRAHVAARKRSYSRYKAKLPETLSFTGIVAGADVVADAPPLITADISRLSGISGSPGEQRGRVRRLPELDRGVMPKQVPPSDPTVLVVPTLDVAWLPALITADAVIAEQGTPQCATALLLRSLAIPCVVQARFALSILEEGEDVLVDGSDGSIGRIAKMGHDESASSSAATAPEDFARLAAPSTSSMKVPTLVAKANALASEIAVRASADDEDEAAKASPPLDATTADLDRTEALIPVPDALVPSEKANVAVGAADAFINDATAPHAEAHASQMSTPFGVPTTMAVEPDQVEEVSEVYYDDVPVRDTSESDEDGEVTHVVDDADETDPPRARILAGEREAGESADEEPAEQA